jgi:hypothetical protein
VTTKLEKPVTRELVGETFKGKDVLVTLRPDNQLEIRLKGSRKPEALISIRTLLDNPAAFSRLSIPARKS